MKTILLTCIVLLSGLFARGEANTDQYPVLRKGDWIDLEHIIRLPVQDSTETPPSWQVENVRKITFRAYVVKETPGYIRYEIYLKHLYHNQDQPEKLWQEYADSYYSGVTLPSAPFLTYTAERTKAIHSIRYVYPDSILSYSTPSVPNGIKNTGRLYQAVTSYRLNLKREIINDLIASLDALHENTGNLPCRITGASFPLPSNTRITYIPSKPLDPADVILTLGSDQVSLQRQEDGTYTAECFIPSPRQATLANSITLRLTPGDTITIRDNGGKHLTFEGTNTANYRFFQELDKSYDYFNLDYQFYFFLKTPQEIKDKIGQGQEIYAGLFEKYGHEMSPYWLQSASLSAKYWEINLRLLANLLYLRKGGTQAAASSPAENAYSIPWDQQPFCGVRPFTDYLYQPDFYSNFLESYFQYKAHQLNEDNLTNKFYWEYGTDTYYLQKQLFSGYPRLVRLAENLEYTMEEYHLSASQREYNDFCTLCKDPDILRQVQDKWNNYLRLEPGANIRSLGLCIADSLPLKKKADGYILLSASYVFGDPQDFITDPLIEGILDEFGIKDKTALCYFRPESRRQFLPDSLKGKNLYRFISDDMTDQNNAALNLSPWAMILMKNDGTILSRDIKKLDSGIGQLRNALKTEIYGKKTEKTFTRTEVLGFLGGFVLCFCIAAIAVLLRFRRVKLQRKFTELELKAIRSQMNPHFIFNAMGSIQSLILQQKNDAANRYLTDFSKLLRNVLNSSEKKLVPLSDEIGQLRLYLQLEQMRIPFEFNISIDPSVDADQEEIPGMLLQPLVENAVIHGIAPRGGGKIGLHFRRESHHLYIEITDNGPGLPAGKENAAAGRFGVRSTRERLELLNKTYHSEIGITLINRQEKENATGCRVIVSIPV